MLVRSTCIRAYTYENVITTRQYRQRRRGFLLRSSFNYHMTPLGSEGQYAFHYGCRGRERELPHVQFSSDPAAVSLCSSVNAMALWSIVNVLKVLHAVCFLLLSTTLNARMGTQNAGYTGAHSAHPEACLHSPLRGSRAFVANSKLGPRIYTSGSANAAPVLSAAN